MTISSDCLSGRLQVSSQPGRGAEEAPRGSISGGSLLPAELEASRSGPQSLTLLATRCSNPRQVCLSFQGLGFPTCKTELITSHLVEGCKWS